MAAASPCRISDIADNYPCLACLSEKELLAVLAQSLAVLNRYDLSAGDLPTLLEDSACISCLSDKQLLQALVGIIGGYADSELSIADIREDVKCLLCVPPQKVRALIVYLACIYFTPVQ